MMMQNECLLAYKSRKNHDDSNGENNEIGRQHDDGRLEATFVGPLPVAN